MLQSFFFRMALTVLRHVLTGIGASLVGDGLLTNDQSTQAVGAVMTLVGIAWASFQAHKDHQNQKTVASIGSTAASIVSDLTGATVQAGPAVIDGGPLPPVK